MLRRRWIQIGVLGIGIQGGEEFCLVAWSSSAPDLVFLNIGAAVIRDLPAQMRCQRIACTGKTCRLRRCRRSRVGLIIKSREQGFAAALARHSHVGHEIIRRTARDTLRLYAAITVTV